MKKLAVCLGLAIALPLLAPTHALAQAQPQAKVRIAIWDFDNNSAGRYWFSDQIGPAVRARLDAAFTDNPRLASRFAVVGRDTAALALKKQRGGTAGAIDAAAAALIGQVLGVRYILVGTVDTFTINRTRAGTNQLGGVSVNQVTADTAVTMRFIDTATGERFLAVTADGNIRKGGASFRGTNLSRDAEWGLASEAAEKAAEELVKKFIDGNYASRFVAEAVNARLEGKVIRVEGDRAWINLGRSAGLKVGDRFTVFSPGEPLIDPDTGVTLGSTEAEIGTAEVVDAQDKFAVVRVTSGKVDTDSLLRRVP